MKRIAMAAIAVLMAALALAGCAPAAQSDDQPAETMRQTETVQQTDAGDTAEPTDAQTPQAQPAATLVIEPEQLISKAEAEMILSGPVEDGEKTQMETAGQRIVYYDPVEMGEVGFLQVSLTQQSTVPAGSTIMPDELYGAAKAGLEDTSDFAPGVIGDECFTGTPGLHILYRGYYIVVAAGNSDKPEVQQVLMSAGKLAVENLERLLAGE